VDKNSTYDYVVIGAGPAGLQLGYFLEKAGHNYLILDATEVGSFFTKYPKNNKLISFNKVHSIYDDPEIQLRWDWNSLLTDDYDFLFRDYSKRLYPHSNEMLSYLKDFATRYSLNIQQKTKIVQVSKDNNGFFCLVDQNESVYICRCLIVATGFSKPYIPDILGIETVEEGYENVSMNPEDFLGQKVLIIGKANSGFEIADNILETASLVHLASPESVELAWQTRHPGHLRADYTRIMDTYQLKLLNGTLDGTIEKIERRDKTFVITINYTHADSEVEELAYDRVIRCTGFKFDDSIFDDTCCPKLILNERLPAMTSMWESTNVPGLFFAGTHMQARDFKKSSSAFIDGFRYNIRTLYHFIESKYHQQPLPNNLVKASSTNLQKATMARICRTSALWTQFGFLCDLIVVDEQKKQAQYYPELPVDYIPDSPFGKSEHYYIITFEWGNWDGDVFAIDRHPSHDKSYTNVFLHPIVRRYTGGELIATHHVLEDLFGMYCYDGIADVRQSISGRNLKQYHYEEHERPLHDFFAKQLKEK